MKHMNEFQIKKIIAGAIIVFSLGLIIVGFFFFNNVKEKQIVNYEKSKISELEDKNKKISDLSKKQDEANQKLAESVVSQDNQMNQRETEIAQKKNPAPPYLIVAKNADDQIYIYEKVLDMAQDPSYIEKPTQDGQIQNPYDKINRINIYTAKINAKYVAYFFYESKVYIYTLSTDNNLYSSDGREKVDAANQQFYQERTKLNVDNSDIQTTTEAPVEKQTKNTVNKK